GEDRTDLAIRGLRAASWMMRHAVETLQPGLVLNWFGPVAVFAGFESALRQINVPRLYVERGAIPMTYVADPIGVLAPSVPTTDPAWRDMMAATPTAGEIACGRRIAALIGADRRENWKSARSFKDGAAPRRTIAYFASNDLGYELRAPACWPAAGLPFGDSERALERLLAAVERVAPDALVVVKPHPFDPLKDRFARFARSTSVVV